MIAREQVSAIAAAAALLAMPACSGSGTQAQYSSDGGFPAMPFVTVASASGALSVDLRSSPQPPPQGIFDVELQVTRVSDGSPVDGLDVLVSTWMPAMNHGAATPAVTAEGGGRYLVSQLDLFMAGYWQVKTTFSGSVHDDATLAFDVP